MNEPTRPPFPNEPMNRPPQPGVANVVKVNPKETEQDFGEVKPKKTANTQRPMPGSDDTMAKQAQQRKQSGESLEGKRKQQDGAAKRGEGKRTKEGGRRGEGRRGEKAGRGREGRGADGVWGRLAGGGGPGVARPCLVRSGAGRWGWTSGPGAVSPRSGERWAG